MYSVSLRYWSTLILLLIFARAAVARDEDGYARLLQGPMLGAMTSESVLIWARTSHLQPVTVCYGTDPWLQAANTQMTPSVMPTTESDRTVRVRLDGLRPGTTYYYRVEIAGRVDKYLAAYPAFHFTTPSTLTVPSRFRVAFGSCYRLQASADDDIWRGLGLWSPDAFIWTGDNIYGDALDPAVLAEEYRRIREVPALQRLLTAIPQLAIWDDHDYGLNNHDREHPGKASALTVFKNYWANGSYGLPDNPGVYSRQSLAGIDFFLLDGRYYRTPNEATDEEPRTMLGARQMGWLRAGLKASRAPFKILVSGSGWSQAKGPRGDAWSAFLAERNALFDFIRDEQISGVVLVSGDTHMGELNAMPWSDRGGYDLYELGSSPLAQRSNPAWIDRFPEVRIRPGYSSSPNVGVMEFELGGADPVLRLVLVDDGGRVCWEPLELRASELRNGAATWRTKIDPRLREAQNRLERGEPYYQ